MDFEHSARSRELQERLLEFMDAHIYPNERRFHEEIEANRSAGNAWQPTKVIEDRRVERQTQQFACDALASEVVDEPWYG